MHLLTRSNPHFCHFKKVRFRCDQNFLSIHKKWKSPIRTVNGKKLKFQHNYTFSIMPDKRNLIAMERRDPFVIKIKYVYAIKRLINETILNGNLKWNFDIVYFIA